MELIKINARGTIIEIPKDIAFRIEYIKNNHNWNNEQIYLNFNADIVHKLLDYISYGETKYLDELKTICDFLLIEIPNYKNSKNNISELQKSIIIDKYNHYAYHRDCNFIEKFSKYMGSDFIHYELISVYDWRDDEQNNITIELFEKDLLNYDDKIIMLSGNSIYPSKSNIETILDKECEIRKKIIDFYEYFNEYYNFFGK